MRSFLIISALFAFALCVPVTVEVQLVNNAPEDGTNFTPLWVAFHDGTVDPFNVGSASSAMIESLAEDGSTTLITNSFNTMNPTFIDGTIVADNSDVPVIRHDQTATAQFVIDSDIHRYVTFITMLIPSNDAFVGNDNPLAYPLFDDDDNFQGATAEWEADDVYDAGTEVNDEIPANTAFFGQTVPNTGVDQNGVIARHDGLLPSGSGGIVDDPDFVNADFTQFNGVFGLVTVREVEVSSVSPVSVSPVSVSPVSVSPVSFSPVSPVTFSPVSPVSTNDDDDDDNSPSSSSSPSSPTTSNDDDDFFGDDDDDSSSASALVASFATVAALAMF